MMKIQEIFKYSAQLLEEILMGIAFYGVMGELVILLFFRSNLLSIGLGFLVGVISTAVAMIQLTWTTEYAMDMNNANEARKHTIKMYLLRVLGFFIVILASYFTGILNMPALFIGMLGLKVGAYLQPFMHKCLVWLHERFNIKS